MCVTFGASIVHDTMYPARAIEVVREGLALYPDQIELVSEKLSLDEFADVMVHSESIQ